MPSRLSPQWLCSNSCNYYAHLPSARFELSAWLHIHIYAIMKTMCLPGCHHSGNGFATTHAFEQICKVQRVGTNPLWFQPRGHIVFMTGYILLLCSSCFCKIRALCMSWVTYDLTIYIYIYITQQKDVYLKWYICHLKCLVIELYFLTFEDKKAY